MKNEISALEEKLGDPDFLRLYQQERLILDAMEKLTGAMELTHTSRSALAALLGRTRSYVTQMLSGSRNLTLRTLADAMAVMGYQATITIEPIESEAVHMEWVGRVTAENQVTFHCMRPTQVDSSQRQLLAS